MLNRLFIITSIILIIMLVCEGLQLVERGVNDLMLLEQPLQVLACRREASGEIVITFAGKTAAIDILEIHSRLLKMWDKLTYIWSSSKRGQVN